MLIVVFIIGVTTFLRKKWEKNTMLIIFFMSLHLISPAQINLYSVQGKMYLSQKGGRLYIFLVDEEHFNIPFTGIDTLIIRVDKSEIFFCFKKVESGIYAIRCYQDLNENRKLDKGLFGPKEPYGLSWKNRKRFPFNFNDVSFNVNQNKYLEIYVN